MRIDIHEVVTETLKGNKVERLLYKVDEKKLLKKEFDIPFYRYQERIILGNNSRIDSKSIDDYIEYGGYKALAKVLLEMSPKDVIAEVKDSKLRGSGRGRISYRAEMGDYKECSWNPQIYDSKC
ncbi:MAG: hypothetical protein U5N58_07500 [Actinomycetota bacterium]|nr:hypothetical protein [Actinomycetota bacterium]